MSKKNHVTTHPFFLFKAFYSKTSQKSHEPGRRTFENSQINRQRIDGNSLSRRERHASPLERREERGSSLFSSPAKISLSATTLSVSWNAPTWEEACAIIQAVNPEYVEVEYPDLLSGNQHEVRTFYVGDRTSPFKCWWAGNKRMESISFDFIER